ncbi:MULTISPECIES: low temperature requirement protein A [unclassified Plantactinospora]|uniref:low temperature requirement protein A n=1 Tax=unclassified Plantactinospora TaxID=2631981 RepID=UPI000D1544A7|nr:MULTISPECIES: low temperature requirement protein A [unclassified Plantactinospora]AVT32597.1 low temperature requirement protein A [Plantactinospora sp. BC1]AVT39235.1 low temperature requirement protein A [Plantactinospora sp. BB1]
MVLGGGAELLRREESSPRATFLELFLDLVYVFALTRVSQRLVHDLTALDQAVFVEALRALVLLLTLWLLWSMTTLMTSRFDPERPLVQAVVVVTMFGSMVMAVAVPRAFGEHGLMFALAYVGLQFGRPFVLGLTLRGDPRQRISVRLVFWTLCTAPLWIGGAFVVGDLRLLLWGVALIADYLGHRLRWPTPRLGSSASQEWVFAGEHIAERYQQFFLIALGESILVTGFAFSGGEFTTAQSAAFLIAFSTTVLLWRIYFFQAGFQLAEGFATARDPTRFAWSATYTHLVIVAGVVTSAVGYELVVARPLGHTDGAWVGVIVGGPALFLAGRARFGYEIFGTLLPSRLVGIAVLVAVAPGMLFVPPLAVAGTVSTILLGITLHDLLRTRGRRPRSPASPL